MTFAVTGSFEDIFELMFGPQDADAHVKAWRHELIIRRHTGNFGALMAEMRAEGRRLAALSKPIPAHFKIAAE